jgi:hypothetical protein
VHNTDQTSDGLAFCRPSSNQQHPAYTLMSVPRGQYGMVTTLDVFTISSPSQISVICAGTDGITYSGAVIVTAVPQNSVN